MAFLAALLAGPLGKYLIGGLALIALGIGAALFISHERETGRAQERAALAAAAAAREAETRTNRDTADGDAARDPDPAATLRKKWERPQ